ncbi:hypothetical protein BJV74DRAFT_796572 [Russula compacta]|nr:hypothetical protein BJV74DRAFT_796572 [Russula compacta]
MATAGGYAAAIWTTPWCLQQPENDHGHPILGSRSLAHQTSGFVPIVGWIAKYATTYNFCGLLLKPHHSQWITEGTCGLRLIWRVTLKQPRLVNTKLPCNVEVKIVEGSYKGIEVFKLAWWPASCSLIAMKPKGQKAWNQCQQDHCQTQIEY